MVLTGIFNKCPLVLLIPTTLLSDEDAVGCCEYKNTRNMRSSSVHEYLKMEAGAEAFFFADAIGSARDVRDPPLPEIDRFIRLVTVEPLSPHWPSAARYCIVPHSFHPIQ